MPGTTHQQTAEAKLGPELPPSKVGEVRTFFEDPQRYLGGRAWNLKLRAETVQELTRGTDFRTVLDIGCGDGSISLPLLKPGIRMTLLDLATNMTRLASSNVPAKLAHQVEFINQDFMKADIAENSYDLVVCMGLLAHVDSPSEFLGKIRRVLKPGGALVLEFSDARHLMGRVLRGYQRLCALRKPRTYALNTLSISVVRRLLERQKLKLVKPFRYMFPPLPLVKMPPDKMRAAARAVFGSATRNRNAWLGSEYICLVTNEKGRE
jgi:ubiquinone/menaquinone biosynthesis C-methylase UbiE